MGMVMRKGRRRFQMRIWRCHLLSTCQKYGCLQRLDRTRLFLPFSIRKGVGSQPGLTGLTRQVDRVSPGQLPDGFLLRPGPVPCPGRPGPGSTRRAGPGFKTMLSAVQKKKHIYIYIMTCHLLLFFT